MDCSFSYHIIKEHHVLITHYSGKLTMKDYIKSVKTFMADPDFIPGMNMLIDCRNCLAISFSADLADFNDFFNGNFSLKSTIKVGVLVSSPNMLFLMKMYKPIGKLQKMHIETFKSEAEVFEFLGFGEKEGLELAECMFNLRSIQHLSTSNRNAT